MKYVYGLLVGFVGSSGCAEQVVIAECTGAVRRCVANQPQKCVNGVWKDESACISQTCRGEGECMGVCAPDEKKCAGDTTHICANGQWTQGEVCPFGCSGDRCLPVSCAALPETCGPEAKENCCAMAEIPSGSFDLVNDAEKPANVSAYVLDRFEITVGRFRKFVEMYPSSMPKVGDGEHPRIPGTGWRSEFDEHMAKTADELRIRLANCGATSTWTDTPGANENRPMNCMQWYEIFAFCAWDGGRLPTDAEWNHAAAGGNEQRYYPWSIPPASANIDSIYSTYECAGDGAPGCTIADILPVGSRSPKGDGRWGHADLGGGIYEMVLDDWLPFPAQIPCNDCAAFGGQSVRVARGGSWYTTRFFQTTTFRHDMEGISRLDDYGGRCARNP